MNITTQKNVKIIKNNKNNKTKKKGRSKSGGEALTSGGFGCIFKPALKCKGTQNRTNGVSKMSLIQHGKQEILEINKIKSKLKGIRNYKKYYLLDIDMCYPDKLTNDDLINFDKKCFSLTRYDINKSNINSKINNVSILNMPDAGIDLHDWLFENNSFSKEKIYLLNKIVIKLLKNGIKNMNNVGVIHNDLKDKNIMIDKEMNTRIIDWGLAGVVGNKQIPIEIMNRPLQNNTPFTAMFISDSFKYNYCVLLKGPHHMII